MKPNFDVLCVAAKKDQKSNEPVLEDSISFNYNEPNQEFEADAVVLVNENGALRSNLVTILELCGYKVRTTRGKNARRIILNWLRHGRKTSESETQS